jgi:hypothetical protein
LQYEFRTTQSAAPAVALAGPRLVS